MESAKTMEINTHQEVLHEPKTSDVGTSDHVDNIEEEPAPHLHSKTYLVVFACCLIQVAQLIQLVGTGAFASNVAEVIGGADISGWMLTAITITFVVTAPIVSQAADYWGRRWLMIILNLAGFTGTIITSRAQSMGVAIVGEAFVGAAFAATPLTFAVTSEVLPHRHRMTGQAFLSAAGGVGSIFSLLVGAKLIEVNGPVGFRILWYINAGIFAIAVILTWLLYNPATRELQTALSTKQKLQRLDWAGYAITMCASVLLVVGLSWAQNPYSWRDSHVLAPLVTGGCLFILLAVYAWKIKVDSFIPHVLFSRDRNLALALVCVFCEGLIFGGTNVYVPFQTAILYEVSSIRISGVYSVAFLAWALFGPVAAVICYRYRKVRSLITAGFTCFLIFSICMATTTLESRFAIWGYQVLLGAGLSLCLNALITAAQLSAPPEYIAIASGLLAATRSLGVTVAVAIYGAIFHSRISNLLPSKIAAAAFAYRLPKSSLTALIGDLANNKADALAKIPGITPEIIGASVLALKEAYLDSFHSVWIACCCFSAFGLIGAFCFVSPRRYLNNHIDAPAESEKELYS